MEYTFFNHALQARFITFAAEMGVATQARDDTMEGSVVAVYDDLDDEQMTRLEEAYEALMAEQMLLAGDEEGWVTHQVMGIHVTRADGSLCTVRLKGEMARRLTEHFSPEEMHELVHAIAQGIENPVSGPICKKL